MDFLKNNRRFSFKLDGTDAWSLDCRSEVTCAGDTVTTVYRFKGGIQRGDEVLCLFDAYRKADGVGLDALVEQLCLGEL